MCGLVGGKEGELKAGGLWEKEQLISNMAVDWGEVCHHPKSGAFCIYIPRDLDVAILPLYHCIILHIFFSSAG